jgi:dihydrofolate reductase
VTTALIWAQTAAGVVGAAGRIPWRLPAEQAIFKALTLGGTVVMGRRTWESLPASVRPLPGRRNGVHSGQAGWTADGAEVVADPAEVGGDLWVIGGEAVWAAYLPVATVALVTTVDLDAPGDAYAPVLGPDWTPTHELELPPDGGVGATVRLMTRGQDTLFVADVRDVLGRSAGSG